MIFYNVDTHNFKEDNHKFSFNQKVRVMSGFYKNLITVVDGWKFPEWYELGVKKTNYYKLKVHEPVLGYHINYEWFEESMLEAVND